MDGARAVKTMKLRYDGACVGCAAPLPAGTRAHYLPPTKTVCCLDCGPTGTPWAAASEPPPPTPVPPAPLPPPSPSARLGGAPTPAPTFVAWPPETPSADPARSVQAETSPPEVRGALVFTNAEFGLFTSPFAVDDVWVGWGRAIRKRLGEEATGSFPVDAVAKRLARELRAG